MKQTVPCAVWPSGEGATVAVLRDSPADLARRLGLRFEQGVDGIGPYDLAAFDDPEAGQLWLFAHRDAPAGTEVQVDSATDPEVALGAIARQLGVECAQLAWRAPGVTARPLVLVLHGPAGVGKDTVIAQLRDLTHIHRAMSTADRQPRDGEQDGVDYHFVTTEEFERRIAAGAFAEYARVYDQWKGLERREIEAPLARGEDLIIRTDVKGARAWRERLEGAIFVCILAAEPTTPAEVHRAITRERMLKRQPDMDPADLEERLREVDAELADAPNNDYVIVNHHNGLESATREILGVIERERCNDSRPRPRLLV